MRVLVAVPTYESVEPETFKSIWDLDPCGHELTYDHVRGYGAARARNLIGAMCLDGGYDAVLMVDSDVVLPPDAMGLLLEGECPVVLGAYPRKGETAGSELFVGGVRDFTEANRVRFADMPDGRFPVKGGGFGCALVRASALRRLPRPWFRYVENPDGSVLSEDLYFCCQCSSHGLRIEGDGRVRCAHIGKRALTGDR